MITPIDSNAIASAANASSKKNTAEGMQDQFMKLLIAQLKNQDPTNPMDNAQMTSQMAQISTVSGLEKLNSTVSSVTAQINSSQMLQGANLVGRTVLVEGNNLAVGSNNQASAAYDLSTAAQNVTVTISDNSGQVIDTVRMGAQNAGRNYVNWDASQYIAAGGDAANLRYRVQAVNAGNEMVSANTLGLTNVVSSTIADGQLALDVGTGRRIGLSDIRSVY